MPRKNFRGNDPVKMYIRLKLQNERYNDLLYACKYYHLLNYW
jgi:hypothetical protein